MRDVGKATYHGGAQSEQHVVEDRERRLSFLDTLVSLEATTVQAQPPVRELVDELHELRHHSVEAVA